MFSRLHFRRRRHHLRSYRVLTPNGTMLAFELEGRTTGEELLSRVMESLSVQERGYFGIAVLEGSSLKWIAPNKALKKQLSGRAPHTLHFRVRLYPRNHHSLLNHHTRHQLFLQVRKDVLENRLKCSSVDITRLSGLVAQVEVGDFHAGTCGAGYLSEVPAIPRMSGQLEETVMQLHRLNRGKSVLECEEEFLDLAQQEPSYGTLSYTLQDSSKRQVVLAISPLTIRVLRGSIETAVFEWDSITKITTKGKHITFHISTTHTLAPYQTQFTTTSSSLAQNLATTLAEMKGFYSSTAADRPKSRLKRFFSSRRSLRRRRPASERVTVPSSNPTPRRGHTAMRRASYSSTGGGAGSAMLSPANKCGDLFVMPSPTLPCPSLPLSTSTPSHHHVQTSTHSESSMGDSAGQRDSISSLDSFARSLGTTLPSGNRDSLSEHKRPSTDPPNLTLPHSPPPHTDPPPTISPTTRGLPQPQLHSPPYTHSHSRRTSIEASRRTSIEAYSSHTSPTYNPPAHTSPTYNPPTHTSPMYNPPTHTSPTYNPPTHTSPTYNPPAHTSPTYNPPTHTSPTYNPPTHTSPMYNPPTHTSPTYNPPTHTSPMYNPPTYRVSPRSQMQPLYEDGQQRRPYSPSSRRDYHHSSARANPHRAPHDPLDPEGAGSYSYSQRGSYGALPNQQNAYRTPVNVERRSSHDHGRTPVNVEPHTERRSSYDHGRTPVNVEPHTERRSSYDHGRTPVNVEPHTERRSSYDHGRTPVNVEPHTERRSSHDHGRTPVNVEPHTERRSSYDHGRTRRYADRRYGGYVTGTGLQHPSPAKDWYRNHSHTSSEGEIEGSIPHHQAYERKVERSPTPGSEHWWRQEDSPSHRPSYPPHRLPYPSHERARYIVEAARKSHSLPPGASLYHRSPSPRYHHPHKLNNMHSPLQLPDDAPGTGEGEWEGGTDEPQLRNSRNKPSRPQNRGRFRLSLQDPDFYFDNTRLHSKQQRHRTLQIQPFSTSASSLPYYRSDLASQGLHSLGSIASLELQRSLAELSQASDSSHIDPHMRSFVFETSQPSPAGTEL